MFRIALNVTEIHSRNTEGSWVVGLYFYMDILQCTKDYGERPTGGD